MSLVWLASYPKSGNTWLRAFLSNYRQDGGTPVSINGGLMSDGGSLSHSFARLLGLPLSALTAAEVQALRPDVYARLAAERDGPRFIKVHNLYELLDDGRPLFPDAASRLALYVVRNPLDLAPSIAAHWDIPELATVVRHMAADAVLPGAPGILAEHLGSWSRHVQSWLYQAKGFPVHLVRYEDMLLSPRRTFGAVVRALDWPLDPARLERAMTASSFGELSRQESAAGFIERVGREPFFRSGRIGEGVDRLGPELVERILESHGETMTRLDYLDENGRIVFDQRTRPAQHEEND